MVIKVWIRSVPPRLKCLSIGSPLVVLLRVLLDYKDCNFANELKHEFRAEWVVRREGTH